MAALKIKELKTTIQKFAKALHDNEAPQPIERALSRLCNAFEGADDRTVTAFIKMVSLTSFPKATWADGTRVSVALCALTSLRELFEGHAKKDVLTALDQVAAFLQPAVDVEIDAFVSAVQDSYKLASQPKPPKAKRVKAAPKPKPEPLTSKEVAAYISRLKAALSDAPRFTLIFKELKEDPRLQKPDAVAIASEVYGHTPPSTSKSKAIERIWRTHENLMDFKRHAPAASRSAA